MRAALGLCLLFACADTQRHVARSSVHVETNPPGAYVAMSDSAGTRTLGRSPIDVELSYTTETWEATSGIWWTPGISGALTLLGTGLALASDSNTAGMVAGLSLAGLAGSVFLISFPIALVLTASDSTVISQGYDLGPPTFEASLPGYSTATAVLSSAEPPPSQPIHLGLHPIDVGVPGGQVLGGLGIIGREPARGLGTLGAGERPVIAVFEIHDPSLDSRLARELTQYLGARLAEHGRFRVVPDADLRVRLSEDKSRTYDPCIDDRCQIEIGKAVAASRSLSTRVLRVGTTCTVSSTLFDLKTEAAETAASVRTACTQEGLLDGLDQVAAKLSAK
ncbi:MAG: hypothetical protein HY791_04010 [Deltaproteobacteria bacterium]|nr:hypothetical protein [Deltaproteobacteria bacterium]